MQFKTAIIAVIGLLSATVAADYDCYQGRFTCANACKNGECRMHAGSDKTWCCL
ncbi:polyketide synthase [Colletotrichum truncatum]|uniref:Polyketide synthase n=1 Tax=Colletotrichum truncatum TaxID=5467 RepID=A0ACC3Z8E4_COLTU